MKKKNPPPSKKWKFIVRPVIEKYKCGLNAGDRLQLKVDLKVKDNKGRVVCIERKGGIWSVIAGVTGGDRIIWLLQPDGAEHTWDDDDSIFDTFQIVK